MARKAPYRSFSDAADKPVWTPVVNPQPRYESNAQKQRWEQAAEDNPRHEGETFGAWAERVAGAARPELCDRELPAGDRQPGEDG